MGAKSFIGTPKLQILFVIKDKLVCTIKKCIVSKATVKVILEHGGCKYKIGHISTIVYPRSLNLESFKN